jgi:hypothetical protein
VAPAATVTEDGTKTRTSLLDRLTVWPLVPAIPATLTLQLTVAAPVTDPLEQLSALTDPGTLSVYVESAYCHAPLMN